MWRGWAVAAVVSRRSTRGRCPPHEDGLSRRFVAVDFRFHVLYLRSKHAVRWSGHRRATSGIAGGSSTFQGVPAAGAYDVDVRCCGVHRRRACDRTGCVG